MDKQQREYIHHLMLQYSDAMVRLTYRRVGDWHLAEDLVQETFLTACCKSERVWFSLLPFCQTASAFRLICTFPYRFQVRGLPRCGFCALELP